MLRRALFGVLLAWLFFLGGLGAAYDKAVPPARAIPTLDSALQHLAERDQDTPDAVGRLAASLGLTLRDEQVSVVVEADALDPAAVAALGGAILHRAPSLPLWEVRLPLQGLRGLAQLDGVRYVRSPSRPVSLGMSQGVALTGAADWHRAGHLGEGVRVAVIDLEFGGLARAVAAGRLTRVVHTRDYTGTGLEVGGPHGVACAEIVQDMAPRAELILMKIDNEVQFALAVADAVSLGARVITHSAGWFNTNFYDGTGVVCDIVRSATDQGVLWVNAAGNSADGAHWRGAWQDRDGDSLLDFASGVNVNSFTAEAGVPFAIWLTWDGWPTTDQDYDLYLVELPSGLVVASSTNTQTGAQPPVEQVFYVPPHPGTYGIVVRGYSVPEAPPIKLFTSSRIKLRYSVAESSIPAPGNAGFVLTVGAIAWSSWTTGPLEAFSSQGPTNRSRLNPVSLVKPDLMAPNRVDTLGYGPSGFPGTSAASPHVAGAAAVVWSVNASWTAAEVRGWLEANAVDMGPPGKDNRYGHGRLRLPAPAAPPPSGAMHTYGDRAGWYLVSVPTAGETAQVFGVPLYRWTGVEYETASALAPTMGYWARLPSAKTVSAAGSVPTTDQTLALDRAGWHMVSAPWTYPKGAIEVSRGRMAWVSWADAVAAGWVRDSVWAYRADDGVYTRPAVLEAWYGYWIYAQVNALTLRFRAGGAPPPPPPGLAPSAVEEMHPPPPPGAFGPTALLQVASVPNPVTDVNTTTFRVLGPMAAWVTEITVAVFDLSGKLVWQGSAAGAELGWHTDDLAGRYLANGVYVYQITAEVAGTTLTSGLMKVSILR